MHLHARTVTRTFAVLALAGGLALSAAGCAAPGGSGEKAASGEVTLVVHSSFPNKEFAKAASKATGLKVKVVSAGDGGELTNKLVLTKGAPIADAFFGVDQIFASRLIDGGITEAYTPKGLPEGAKRLAADDRGALTAVDYGATCLNIDTGWFAKHGIAAPTGYDALTDAKYKDLAVVLDPTASSTGGSFLVGTVAKFGENGFADYWKRVAKNGTRVEQGWTEAYNGQFTQGGGAGTRPIVVSYATSPAWTLTKDGSATTTAALLDTCSNQVEYAGVLKGAANSAGAKQVVDYLVSREFQDTIADSMYMFPVDAGAKVPAKWTKFAPKPEKPNDLPAAEIGANREAWLKTWSTATGW